MTCEDSRIARADADCNDSRGEGTGDNKGQPVVVMRCFS